ncbi:hypothetical protein CHINAEXTREME_05505 [Halobiforma lacisalsi AJ5]|uniref:Uncharacterized protein n=1 Tax=Natronobacterium lacisalsi AJ5 TaxID=358396 RepID=M0LP06_NATLA|nr:hypothetical protein [Halobiforma lacisalsi]APW97260.1 hypothetical protein CHINAEXTREME_05505 [Halobiforma lacisalsi AJ5]EMA33770.1 hypothetical protein C445_08779 [Halobiforma lacisalsi AJ5]
MEEYLTFYLSALVCGVLAVATVETIVGPVIFGSIALWCLVRGTELRHGELPWWGKRIRGLFGGRKDS